MGLGVFLFYFALVLNVESGRFVTADEGAAEGAHLGSLASIVKEVHELMEMERGTASLDGTFSVQGRRFPGQS